MIHFGKTPQGDLELMLSAEGVGELYDLLQSAGLQQGSTFNGLKEYIKNSFADELGRYSVSAKTENTGK